MSWSTRNYLLIPAALLLLAALPLPYGYYAFLRWVVSISAITAALADYRISNTLNWRVTAMGLTAILFNPLAPVWFHRLIWLPIDIIAASLFIYTALKEKAFGG